LAAETAGEAIGPGANPSYLRPGARSASTTAPTKPQDFLKGGESMKVKTSIKAGMDDCGSGGETLLN